MCLVGVQQAAQVQENQTESEDRGVKSSKGQAIEMDSTCKKNSEYLQ